MDTTQTPLLKPQSQDSSGVSPLFYVSFVLTVVIFLGLVGYVVLSLNKASLQQSEDTASRQYVPEPTIIPSPSDSTTKELLLQGTSDETSEIEKDVIGTDLSGIDVEMAEVETNLSSE